MLAFFLFDSNSSFASGAMIVMTMLLIYKICQNFGVILKWLLLIGLFIVLVITDAIIWIPVSYFALIVCAGIVSLVRKNLGYKPIKRRRKVKKVLPSGASEDVVHTEKTQGTILDYILVGIVAIMIVSSIVMLISGIID